MIDPKWLFQNYKTHLARIQVLEYLLDEFECHEINDNSIIEMIIYRRETDSAVQHSGYRKSRTEYAAINLDEIRKENYEEISAMNKKWKEELVRLKLYVYMHDAALNAMTDEERMLIKLYYEEGHTMDEITCLPLTNRAAGLKSKSTIKRMLKNITEKSLCIINIASRDI